VAEIDIELPKLAPFQEEWMRATERFVGIEGATGTGKTYVYEPELFSMAHEVRNRGDEFWWIAPTIAQARAVYENIKRSLGDSGALHLYRCVDTLREIHTPEGGILCYKTGEDPNTLFGIRNVRMIVVDEFTRCRMSLWPALLSVANKTGARVIFIGNYQGDDTEWHLWVKRMQASEEFRYFRTTALEAVAAGIMPQAAYDTAKATLPEGIFNALYLCQGSSDPSLLVKHAAVADLWHNTHVSEGKKALTCDIAMHGSDRFVMHAWSGLILKEITVLTKRDAKAIEDIIRGKALEHEVQRHNIAYDADGMGAYLKGYLQGATPYQGGTAATPMQGRKMSYQNLRSQCHFLTADAINEGRMWVATDAYREELEPEIFACLRTSGQDAALRWGIIPKDRDDPKMPGAKRRLGRSPDLFDPIPMRMYLDLAPSPIFAQDVKHRAEEVRKRITIRRDRPTTTFRER
jgi:hypothetical protein